MLIIRFSRVGKKNYAQYRIVLSEKSSPVKGRFVELLGSYDPHQKKATLKEDRIKYWLGKGVQCSDSIFNLFISKGIMMGEKRKVKIPAKQQAEGEVEKKGKKSSSEGETAEKPEELKTEEAKPTVEEKKKETTKTTEKTQEAIQEQESEKEIEAKKENN